MQVMRWSALAGTTALWIAACSTPYAGDEDFPAAGADGGEAGSRPVVVPADCDLQKSPKDSTSCIDDAVGVFVAPSGNDASRGLKASPVRSIGKAIELAAGSGVPRVYVCEGSYDENVAMGVTAISVFGGFDCSWRYTGTRPRIAPPSGIALLIARMAASVVMEDLEVDGASDPAIPGSSAIATFVSESASVTFRNVVMVAGKAVNGAAGTTPMQSGAAAKAGGTVLVPGIPGSGYLCMCAAGRSSRGGDGANSFGMNAESGSALPAVGQANSGLSGATTCVAGSAGANGNPYPPSDVVRAGYISVSGWMTPLPLLNEATSGNPGQGGGGGGAKTQSMVAGGGGGCGGCGGAAGTDGGAGGSSFALLSFESSIKVEGGALSSGGAGNGGAGGAGQAGFAGAGGGASPACSGGAGGAGAGGNGGNGGAGGLSIAIAFAGSVPLATNATITAGSAGMGGAAGLPGAGPGIAGNAGIAGAMGTSASTQQR